MLRIELTSDFNARVLKFSGKFGTAFSHVFVFGNIFPESHGFIGYKPYHRYIHVPIYPYLISEIR